MNSTTLTATVVLTLALRWPGVEQQALHRERPNRHRERAGPQDLVTGHGQIHRPGGGSARLKVPAFVAAMLAGADSI